MSATESTLENRPLIDPLRKQSSKDEVEGELEFEEPPREFKSSADRLKEQKQKAMVVALMVFMVIAVTCFCGGFAVGYFAVPRDSSCNISELLRKEVCADPPLLIISLDGFWEGYFERFPQNTTFLRKIASEGVKAEYMRSSFPTKTFPNHFSIVTGLYPESHGIVDNYFYDKNLTDTFYIGARDANDPKWWLGEPVWVTAAKQNMKSRIFFWPGSEVLIEGIRPDLFFPYNTEVPFDTRVKAVLSWLDLPKRDRPKFLSLYFSEPDHSGHLGGPQSSLVDAALGIVDETIEEIFRGLEERGIEDCVNVMIVSDHGMAQYNKSRLVYLDELIPEEYSPFVVFNTTLGPNAQININGNSSIVKAVYDVLQRASDANSSFHAYLLKDIPARLHAGQFNTQRYGDIYLAGKLGAFLTTKNPSKGNPIPGQHGYDNNEEEMEAIFIAHGPAFKNGFTTPAFDNVQLYNLMCALLNITPSANDGTVGSLNLILKSDVAVRLPPAVYSEGEGGVVDNCPFPADAATYNSRVFCPLCSCSHCPLNHSAISDANEKLDLTTKQAKQYQSLHLPWGVPSGGEGGGACLLSQEEYIVQYSTTLHVPLWLAYRLTAEQASNNGHAPTTPCYRRDPRIDSAHSANCTDYDATLSYSRAALYPIAMPTSVLPSIVPQMTVFQKGVWNYMESLVREWAQTYGTIYVIAGSVLDSDNDGRRDSDEDYPEWLRGRGSAAVPSHFFLVATHCSDAATVNPNSCPPTSLETLGVVLAHTNTTTEDTASYIQLRLTLIQDIQGVTGVNFFPDLPAEGQNNIGLRIVRRLWPANQ